MLRKPHTPSVSVPLFHSDVKCYEYIIQYTQTNTVQQGIRLCLLIGPWVLSYGLSRHAQDIELAIILLQL